MRMKKIGLLCICGILLLACAVAPKAASSAAPVLTEAPTVKPTAVPTPEPTEEPTPEPTEEPTPEPTETPTPEPTETPTPEPTEAPTPDPNRKMVALTFDDGPNGTYTPQFLDLLERHGVRATFFVHGTATTEKTAPLLQRMVENAKRIERTRQKISDSIEGGYETHLMRPPGGAQNGTVRSGAKDAETAVILWSVDTVDWKTRNKKEILKICRSKIQNGSIILCHDRIDATLKAVDELIPWLKEQGYDLVTVTELLNSSGSPIEYGTAYRCKTIEP